jgi:histone H1/5
MDELEKKWETDVNQLIEEVDDEQAIVQDKKAEAKLKREAVKK